MNIVSTVNKQQLNRNIAAEIFKINLLLVYEYSDDSAEVTLDIAVIM